MTAQRGLEQGADIAIQAALVERVFGIEILGKGNAHLRTINPIGSGKA
jgi:hypothetical protein